MSLRGHAIEETATLPDGRAAVVWVGVASDPYIAERDLDTVALELRVDGEVAAVLNSVLDSDDESEARQLAREVASRLESGELEPSAGAIEPLVDELR